MTPTQSAVEDVVRSFLDRMKRSPEAFEAGTPLGAEGFGLDSLEMAELSATLEDTFGTDPFTDGPIPTTLGDVLEFYASLDAS